jgi:hypothetical protein
MDGSSDDDLVASYRLVREVPNFQGPPTGQRGIMDPLSVREC